MKSHLVEIRVEGRTLSVPAAEVCGRTVIATGNWVKTASVEDEDFVEGEAVSDPEGFIGRLKTVGLEADIFTFAQQLPDVTPRYGYRFELDNVAAIPTASYEEWWTKRVAHNLRTDVKRARKRGVVVRLAEFTDEFVRGIVDIYRETPVRQGRPFWHYAKDFDSIKRETATYLKRSEFLGAYLNDELIGFLKIVYVGKLGRLMQIVSKVAHQDKRPTNALIAKAVELCETRKCTHLTYGKYVYGKAPNSLTDFKCRNGFEQIFLPKYYIPLTAKGQVVLKLGLQHGIRSLLPRGVLASISQARSKFFNRFTRASRLQTTRMAGSESSGQVTTDRC
jgi:hypothetical protein